MCGRSKKGNKVIRPGFVTTIKTRYGNRNMMWGNSQGQYYNARSEKLYSLYKKYIHSKCILEVTSFKEGKGEFTSENGVIKLGGIHNNKYFMILTILANEIVSPFNNRMPLIVNDLEELFLFSNISINVFKSTLKLENL